MKHYLMFQVGLTLILYLAWIAADTSFNYVVVAIFLSFIIIQTYRLFSFLRFYSQAMAHRLPYSDVKAVDLLMQQSTNLTYRYNLLSLAVTLPLLVLPAIYDLPLAWIFIGLWCGISGVIAHLSIIYSPLILLLSVSGPSASKLHLMINAAIYPMRAAHCLLPTAAADTPQPGFLATISMGPTSLRTYDEAQWRYTIDCMLDIVMLVIVDISQTSAALTEEIEAIHKRGLESKTVFVGAAQSYSPVDLPSPKITEDQLLSMLRLLRSQPALLAQTTFSSKLLAQSE